MSSADPPASAGNPIEVRAAARASVQEVVTAGGACGHSGRRWMVPLAAAAAVAAAACTPVAWPLLAGGTLVAPALAAAFGQVGAVGGGLLAEVVIRAWDQLRAHEGTHIGQSDLREALTDELAEALVSSSAAAAGLRAEVAGVLQGVDAVKVALTTTIETTAWESADQVRAVLIGGLRELGTQFTEFGWLLEEVNDQITLIAETQAEIAADFRAMLEAQQRTVMELTILRQQTRPVRVIGGPGGQPEAGDTSPDQERAAALEAAGVPVDPECPYPGLAAFGPQDGDRFFGRQQLTAVVVTRLAEQLTRPGLLIVLGPSGSGKSSLLRAGLLPAIAAGGLPVRGSQAWPLDLMTPGRRPLLELAARIAALAGIPAGALHADLRTDPARIIAAIRQALLAHARRQAQSCGLSPGPAPAVMDMDVTGYQVDGATAAVGWAAEAGPGQVASSPRLVLIIDQLEELFTQCADEQERRAFIHALCAAAGTTEAPPLPGGGISGGLLSSRDASAMVVIGMRADFYTRSATYPELVPYLQDCQVLVGPMDQVGLRAAIEKPATMAGLVADAALVERLLADLGLRAHSDVMPTSTVEGFRAREVTTGGDSYEAGRLALLSYALQQTWHKTEGRRLTVAGYLATGGIDGAVAQAADNVYNKLDSAGQHALRRVLLRLVALGEEGTPDSRRRATLAELANSEDGTRASLTRAVLDKLINARLVTADEDTVEITHEILLTAWPRLRQWLTDDREGLRIHRDLTGAARDWGHVGHDPGRLFRGTRLAVTRDWAADHGQELNHNERAFLTASQHDQLRTTRRRRIAIGALAALTLLSVGTAGAAVYSNGQALSERDQAVTNQVVAEAEQLQSTDLSMAAQLDLIIRHRHPTPDNTSQLLGTANIPLANPLTGPTGLFGPVAFSPDGNTLATGGGRDGSIWLWNVTNPAHPTRIGQPLTGHIVAVRTVAFSPDGHTLASGSLDGSIWLWNVTNPAHPTRIGQPLSGPVGLNSVAFSPDGHTLAGDNFSGGTIWLWNVTDPAHPSQIGKPLPGPGGYLGSMAFSPDGHTLASSSSGGGGSIWLWNVTDPAHPTRIGRPLTGPGGAVESVAFSPDGHTLAAGGSDGSIWLWNVTDPAHTSQIGRPLTGPGGAVESVAFSPDGHTLAAGGSDGTIWLWNVTNPAHTSQIGRPLTGPGGAVASLVFSPDGHTLAAGSSDGTIRLWNLPSTILTGPTDGIDSVAFSRDGHILAGDGGDGSIWLWNVTNPAHPSQIGKPLTVSAGRVGSMAFSPDGHTLAGGSLDDGRIWLWNVTDPAHPSQIGQPLTVSADIIYSVAFSPDGHTLAGDGGGTIWLWNVTDPAHPSRVGKPLTGGSTVDSVAFSPDGRTLAGDGGGTIWLWNVTDPAHPSQIGRPLTGPAGTIDSVAFSPDGHTLASGGDGSIWLWNITDPAHPSQIGKPSTGSTSPVESVAFSPDGHTLATGSDDGTIWLWNVTDPAHPSQVGQPLSGPAGDPIYSGPVGDPVYSVAFSPDGHTVATGNHDAARLWDLDIDHAIDRICATTSGNLTPQRWVLYLSPLPYDPPCRHR